MNHKHALCTVLFVASTFSAFAADAEEAANTVRANVAQNGGEAIDPAHKGVYAAGLNGRVRPVVPVVPKVRPNMAQNGGEVVDPAHAGVYAAGLNGRPPATLATNAESADKQ